MFRFHPTGALFKYTGNIKYQKHGSKNYYQGNYHSNNGAFIKYNIFFFTGFFIFASILIAHNTLHYPSNLNKIIRKQPLRL